MGTEKEYIKIIPRIYRASFEDILLFGWVEGQKNILPADPVEKIIYKFFRRFGEDGNIESHITTYDRMKQKYWENEKK
jgi:hypothetical protein